MLAAYIKLSFQNWMRFNRAGMEHTHPCYNQANGPRLVSAFMVPYLPHRSHVVNDMKTGSVKK